MSREQFSEAIFNLNALNQLPFQHFSSDTLAATSSNFPELPEYRLTNFPDLDDSPEELLKDGYQTYKYPADGLIDFFSVKIATSNARAMAQLFQLTMGFQEVAYRGLETDSQKIGSHVIANGHVLIELVNTLEEVKEVYHGNINGNTSNLNRFAIADFQGAEAGKNLAQEMAEKLREYVFGIGEHKIRMMMGMNEISSSGGNFRIGLDNFQRSLVHSKKYREIVNQYYQSIVNVGEITSNLLNDIFDSYSIQSFISKHGQGVIDVSMKVTDVDKIFNRAVSMGANPVKAPRVYTDHQGSVKLAVIQVPDTDIQHTFVENIDYTGKYLPGYGGPSICEEDIDSNYTKHLATMSPVSLANLDHVVQNYTWNEMMPQARFYARILGLHKFWSVDEQDVSTGETALRSIVMASSNGKVRIPINEPAAGTKRGQIEEFYDFNGGPGIQHMALRTYDIIATVRAMRERGVEFNGISEAYYDNLSSRLARDRIELFEDFNALRQLHILVDYDASTKFLMKKGKLETKKYHCNYILQIFTKPSHDRPTLFIEIIQRHHHNGFGKGTFKGLFESIEAQQRLRGTLTDVEEQ